MKKIVLVWASSSTEQQKLPFTHWYVNSITHIRLDFYCMSIYYKFYESYWQQNHSNKQQHAITLDWKGVFN